MGKSELIINMTVKATNTYKYKEVMLGTYTFRVEPSGTPTKLIKRIGNDIGFSKDLNAVFLDSIEIRPRMIEARPKKATNEHKEEAES